jgi:hypothetical protein
MMAPNIPVVYASRSGSTIEGLQWLPKGLMQSGKIKEE